MAVGPLRRLTIPGAFGELVLFRTVSGFDSIFARIRAEEVDVAAASRVG